jgi:hypothetical protein
MKNDDFDMFAKMLNGMAMGTGDDLKNPPDAEEA